MSDVYPADAGTGRRVLRRSRTHRVIGGVCGGIAERCDVRPSVVRLIAVISCVLPGPQVLVYLVLWILIPNASR